MKEKDILARQSRPQKYSTYVPKKRDWRFATGVFQHDDSADTPRDRTIWERMDSDYLARGKEKGSRVSPSKSRTRSPRKQFTKKLIAEPSKPDSKNIGDTIVSPVDVLRPGTPNTVKFLQKTSMSDAKNQLSAQNFDISQQFDHEAMRLLVRLRFTGAYVSQVQQIVGETAHHVSALLPSSSGQSSETSQPTLGFSSIETPGTSQTTTTATMTIVTSSIPNRPGSKHPFPLLQSSWTDETRDFNMKTVRATLKDKNETVQDLGLKYHWYADAVHVNAIFPPGVPLSAKEIMAYYPHHVRWKGVMLRLTNNDYRGADIMGMQDFFRGPPTHNITSNQMNHLQRDAVKATIPNFKTVDFTSHPDSNLYTDALARGKSLEEISKTLTLPSFNDLLSRLRHLPCGLDARGLTQCLTWYMHIRDTFTPRLEVNVLHTQALLRALRHPCKPLGSRNLDVIALREWREKGQFDKLEVWCEEAQEKDGENAQQSAGKKYGRSQLHIDLPSGDVKMNLTLPVRHVLVFPFIALHSVVGEAFQMGIDKASRRQEEREVERVEKAAVNKTEPADKKTTRGSERHMHKTTEGKFPYRLPKRPFLIPADEVDASTPSKKKPRLHGSSVPHDVTSTARGTITSSHRTTPSPSESTPPSRPPKGLQGSCARKVAALSSTDHVRQHRFPETPYGRR